MNTANDRFRKIAESTPFMVWVTEANGKCSFVSRSWFEFTGQTPEEALGFGWLDVIHPDDRTQVEQTFRRSNKARSPFYMEYRVRRSDGSYGWVMAAGNPRFAEDNKFLGYTGNVIDVTELKEASASLARSREKLRTITDVVPALIGYIDAEERYQFINGEWEKWFECSKEMVIGRKLSEVIGDEVYNCIRSYISRALEGERVRFESELQLPSGRGRWVEAHYIPDRDGSGRIIGFYALMLDVTERHRAAIQHARLAAIVQSSNDAILVSDMENTILNWNIGAEKLFGYKADEVIGKTMEFLVPADRLSELQFIVRRIRSGKAIKPFDTKRLKKDGTSFDVSLSLSPLKDEQGKLIGISRVIRDITESKQAAVEIESLNKTLQEKVSELETLLNVIPVGIGIASDPECRRIQVNAAFSEMLQIPSDSNASKSAPPEESPTTFRCLFDDGSEVPSHQLPMQRAAGEGVSIKDWELVLEREDGSRLRLLEYAAPLFNSKGEVRGSVGAFVDITERSKFAERQEFLIRLDDAVRPLSDPVEIMEMTSRMLGQHLKVNRCAYADVEADENTNNVLGDYNQGVRSIVGRYTLEQFGDEVLKRMRENRPFVMNDVESHEPPPRDLSAYRQAEIRAAICVPLHKGGRLAACIAVHQKTPREWRSEEVELLRYAVNRCWESIERARVSRDLRQSEARFRLLANSIPQLAWMADPTGWIFWYNNRWYEYTGSTPQEMQGWGWQRVHDPKELPRIMKSWQAALESGQQWQDEFPIRRHDGAFRWHLTRAVPLKDSKGKVTLWFGTNTDVTETRRMVEERQQLLERERQARAEAERAGRMKDDFLATLSHELRTPLNAILGYSTLIRMSKVKGPELDSAVETIERNAKLQAQLIEDLLDMNRIISGKIRIEMELLDLPGVINAAVSTIRPSAQAKGIYLATTLNDISGSVRGDAARIQQVVWNLLTNAVKFTKRGGSISVALEEHESQAQITVKDTGIGIAKEFFPHVFDRFRQADASTTRSHGGLGLGLSIVKHLVELHGGSVHVESEGENKGSSFIVRLPAAALKEVESAGADSQAIKREVDRREVSLKGIKVLAVDDEQDSRLLVKHVLEKRDASVDVAASVREAMRLLRSKCYNVVLTDIGMPEEDGYEFLRQMRHGSGVLCPAVPAIALTAFARTEDQTKAALAGFDAHIAKPIEAEELISIVSIHVKDGGLLGG
ncbi:MAG: PAS domain S-box protein [Deltaproteobacteria bacterium]|nr:PAS domain S-box protein [Deltaproteobacteria bacterium]